MADLILNNLTAQSGMSENDLLRINAMKRINREVTLLAPSSRASTTTTSNFSIYDSTAVIFFLNVTAVGVGNIFVQPELFDPLSATYSYLPDAAPLVTATGTYVYHYGRGMVPTANVINTATHKMWTCLLSRTMRVQVVHSGVNPFTYSLSMSLSP